MTRSTFLDNLIQLVNNLCDYRDTYLNTILDIDLFSKDITEKFHKYLIGSDDSLHEHLTSLIRRVVHASDCKEELLEYRVGEVIEAISAFESELTDISPSDKAFLYYLRGKALNVLPLSNDSTRRSEAKLSLLNALKLNPSLSDAWCELAELNWMEGEPALAIAPLRSALHHDNHHSESLWRLSMLFRQLPENFSKQAIDDLLSPSQDLDLLKLLPTLEAVDGGASSTNASRGDSAPSQTSAILLSVRLAYSSVRAAPQSGRAWDCLGNALLTTLPLRRSMLNSNATRCLGAFSQAVKDPRVAMEPHFHYNRGVAYLYEDIFSGALMSWFRAAMLDPAWPAPRVYAMRLANALCRISGEISAFRLNPARSNSSLNKKQRRLQELIQSLSPCLICCHERQSPRSPQSNSTKTKMTNLPSALAKMLGPYFDPSQLTCTTTSTPTSLTNTMPKLKLTSFNNLKIGSNKGSVCCGKVVSNLPSDSSLTLNLLISDAEGTLMLLRIFHIGQGVGPSVKDVLSLPDPFIEECHVSKELLQVIFTFDSSILAEGGSSVDEVDDDAAIDASFSRHASLKDLSDLNDINVKIIRVPTPSILCVNGRLVGQSWTAPVTLKNVFFTCS